MTPRWTLLLALAALLACEDISQYPRNNPLDPVNLEGAAPDTAVDALPSRVDAAPPIDAAPLPVDAAPPPADAAPPLADAAPECVAGDLESEACALPGGQAGARTRVCRAEGLWSEWTSCRADECMPGSVETQECAPLSPEGRQSLQARDCLQSRVWGPWGACRTCVHQPDDPAQNITLAECGGGCGTQVWDCQPDGRWNIVPCALKDALDCFAGDVDRQVCPCGDVAERACEASCNWGPWSPCRVGECDPGDVRTEICATCGEPEVTQLQCQNDCAWPEFECSVGFLCAPGERRTERCGPCQSGTREAVCREDACSWEIDQTCNPVVDVECDPEAYPVNACPCAEEIPSCSPETCTITECPPCQSYACMDTLIAVPDPRCEAFELSEFDAEALPNNLFLECRSDQGGKVMLLSTLPRRCSGGVDPISDGQRGCNGLEDGRAHCAWIDCCPEGAPATGPNFEVLLEVACDSVGARTWVDPALLVGREAVYFVGVTGSMDVWRVRGCVSEGSGGGEGRP